MTQATHRPHIMLRPRHLGVSVLKAGTACLLAAAIFVSTTIRGSDLPELGDPASQTITPAQEQKIGQQFYRQLRAHPGFISDPLLAHYIQSLGDQLVNRNNLGNDKFTFFLIDNPAINAFAAPGGYIGFYSGLVEAAQNESQLVSVVAHEIAHVTQRHLARLYAKQADISLATVAAVIAGIAVGGQAGRASIYAGLAAQQQAQLNFTRSNEEEADRIGVQLMVNGGFAPGGMPAMLDVIQQAKLQGENASTEFLRTHPLSARRIADSRARANSIADTAIGNPEIGNLGGNTVVDSVRFQLIKARLDVITTDNLPLLHRHYQNRFAEHQDVRNHYALALIQQNLSDYTAAQKHIDWLEQHAPQSILVALLSAGNLLAQKQPAAAFARYEELHRNYPEHYPILNAYVQALGAIGDHEKASKLLHGFLFSVGEPKAAVHKSLAYHQEQTGEMAKSHLNLAEYFLINDDPSAAFSQLKLALRQPHISAEDKLRANAKLDQVKQLQLERQQ